MLGDRIDERRRALGLSQKELAARSGLSPQYINMLIHDKRGQRIGADAARGLTKALRVSQKFLASEFTQVDKSSTKAT